MDCVFWDLRLVRAELSKWDLDWKAPPFPAPARAASSWPLVKIISGNETLFSQAADLLARGRLDDAIAAYQKTILADPKNSEASNQLDILQKARQAKSRFVFKNREGTLTQNVKKQIHELKMTVGTVYVLDMESTTFDTLLQLHDAEGKLLAENDDIVPAMNLNSRIVFAPTTDGVYRLAATSFQGVGTGNYTLRIRELASGK